MARRPINDEGMQKTLSVRISEKVTAFLEQTRSKLERDGERSSTSEVARQMLDSVVEQQLPMGFVLDKEERLREILRAHRDDLPLAQDHYAFLAIQAHAAYQKTNRDFVRLDLLLSNLDAFEAIVCLRDRTNAGYDLKDDRYFFGNLGSKAQSESTLIAAIQQARENIQSLGTPYRSTAEFISRNLEVILSKHMGLSNDAVDEALRPYLKNLLSLSLKAFSVENDRPVDGIDNRHEMLDRLKIRSSMNHRNDSFELSFIDGNEDLSAYLTPVTGAWFLTCRYQRFMDLSQLIEMNRSANSDFFKLTRVPVTGIYQLSARDAPFDIGLTLNERQMDDLRNLIFSVLNEPEYQRVFSLLDLRYGAI